MNEHSVVQIENRVDALVHELYGLTEDEINIVEGKYV